jgi:cytochrome P450
MPTSKELISAIVSGGVQNPFPLYDELREIDDGVHWADELGGWVCTRYDDVRRIYTEHETFSSDTYSDPHDAVYGPAVGEHRRFLDIFVQQFMLTDPPAHTEVRSLLRRAFTPRYLQRWRTVIDEVAEAILGKVNPDHDVDVMTQLAPLVPITVIAAMLGVPPEDTDRFRYWTDAFVATFNPTIVGAERDQAVTASLELFDYLAARVEDRRIKPADDLITLAGTTALRDGAPMTVSRAVAQLALLLVAGNETTANLIGNGMTLLIDNPHVHRDLCQNPGLLAAGIEEMLRLDPPLHLIVRKVVNPATMGGRDMSPGELCWQLNPAANRDPRVFANPNAFSFNRGNNPHLAFAHGIHFCLGAPLARMEGEVVFAKLLERYPDFTAGAEPAVRKTEAIISRGWLTRPVALTRAR